MLKYSNTVGVLKNRSSVHESSLVGVAVAPIHEGTLITGAVLRSLVACTLKGRLRSSICLDFLSTSNPVKAPCGGNLPITWPNLAALAAICIYPAGRGGNWAMVSVCSKGPIRFSVSIISFPPTTDCHFDFYFWMHLCITFATRRLAHPRRVCARSFYTLPFGPFCLHYSMPILVPVGTPVNPFHLLPTGRFDFDKFAHTGAFDVAI